MQERAGERARDVGPPRRAVVAIGDDHAGIVGGRAARDIYDPAGAASGRLDLFDGGMRANRVAKAEVGRVATQVGEALAMIGIGRPVAGHREIGVFGERLRTDQPRRIKHARRR
jgi:hypothetical protein